jgi:hypothetical protein
MFALDSFSPEYTIWQQIGAFLIHLIPSYVLVALLIIAWKWERVGGIVFSLVGIAFGVLIFVTNHSRNHFSTAQSLFNTFLIAFPFVIVGVLFILHARKQKLNR